MIPPTRRVAERVDRRSVPRGGRRETDRRSGRHPNVLVADSYEGARVPCVRYLQHLGFRVEQAADGEQALALIRATPPDLIVTEQRLPKMPASRLKQRLAQHERTQHIPIIVTVSDFDLGDADRESQGMASVLVKPFPLTAMINEVRRVLRRRNRASGIG